jgi:predicted nucleotide-binding protein
MSGLDDWMGRREARRREGRWRDTMQVCENGHMITSMVKKHPEDMKKRCPDCGAPTITACKECQAPIPGQDHDPDFYFSTSRPDYCDNCGKPYPWAGQRNLEMGVSMTPASNKVFVVHGHAEDMKQAMARALVTLGLDPIILHEKPNQGRTIIEKFEDYADVGFAVVLLSGDDMAYPSGVEHKIAKPRPRARQNVVMELGFFLAKLGRAKVFALYKQAADFELPSDYQGILYTAYDAAGHWMLTLVRELKAAQYDVDANKLIRS